MSKLACYWCIFLPLAAWAAEPLSYRDFVTPDIRQDDLLGQVKSVQETTFDLSEEGKRERTSESVKIYDAAGYLLKESETDFESGEKTASKRSYDEKGSLVAEEETKGSQPAVVRSIRLMPERRRVIKEETGRDGRKRMVEEMTYDRFGKEGNGRGFRADGQVVSAYQTKRDAKGREVEVIFSDGQGKAEDVITLTWDERNFVVKEVHDSRKEKFTATETNEYPNVDGQGNWTEQISTTHFRQKGRDLSPSQSVTIRVIEYY